MKHGKRIVSGALALLLVLTACVTTGVSAFAATDAQTAVVQQWVDEGLLTGNEDGDLREDEIITRAELIHLMVLIGFTGDASTVTYSYTDVEDNAWYHDDIMSATAAGYVSGRANGSFGPRDTVTRQEAIAMVVRAMGLTLDEEKGEGENCSSWFYGEIGAAITAGLYGSGTDFTADLTRAEAVCLLESVRDKTGTSTSSGLVGVSGTGTGLETVTTVTGEDKTVTSKTTTLSGTYADVTLSSKLGTSAYTLDDVVITGDLIIESTGTITLEDVTVEGDIIVEGHGAKIVLKSEADVTSVVFNDSGTISGSSYTDTVELITVDAENKNDSVTIAVDADEVVISSRCYVYIKSDVDELTVESGAKYAIVEITKSASVDTVNLNAACVLYGSGDIDDLYINASNVTIARTLDIDDTTKASGVKNITYVWSYYEDDYCDDYEPTVINGGTISLKVGETKTLSSKAAVKSVYYTSSNTSVATVNKSTGVVTAKSAGTAVIYAKDSATGYTVEKWTVKVTGTAASVDPNAGTVDPGSSSGSSSSATYSISTGYTGEGGTVSVDTSAASGDSVTVSVSASAGYTVTSITVTSGSTTVGSWTGSQSFASLTFTMPSGDVSVSATFSPIDGSSENSESEVSATSSETTDNGVAAVSESTDSSSTDTADTSTEGTQPPAGEGETPPTKPAGEE